MRKYFVKALAPIFSISVFITAFSLSIFLVYGYRYDFEEKEVVSTSVVDVCIIQENANIYLDQELRTSDSCDKFFGMDLGRHKLEAKKLDYFSWKKDFYLGRERAAVYKNVFLIPRHEFMSIVELDEDIDLFFESKKEDFNNPIIVDGFEIWKKKGDKKSFITRYSVPVQQAQYFYNSSNLLITTNEGVYVCDFEAENCQLITSKDSDSSIFHKLHTKKITFVKNGLLQEISLKYSKDNIEDTEESL